MSLSKFLGSFVQATLFGGTYDDLSFELRVLKSELAALHHRLDTEFDALADRLDQLEGKPGKGKGRGRLAIMGAPELADLEEEPTREASPVAAPEPAWVEASPSGLGVGQGTSAPEPLAPGFLADMTIRDAWMAHPEAPAIFARHHLPGCIDCALSARESLAEGAGDHGLDVQALLRDLNQLGAA